MAASIIVAAPVVTVITDGDQPLRDQQQPQSWICMFMFGSTSSAEFEE
ncbi:MAG: hypothetical protein P1T08_18380 [Acidimicrobiia bacterium]|nr:hypothetical protein [Acidimicrobiia bacterium]